MKRTDACDRCHGNLRAFRPYRGGADRQPLADAGAVANDARERPLHRPVMSAALAQAAMLTQP